MAFTYAKVAIFALVAISFCYSLPVEKSDNSKTKVLVSKGEISVQNTIIRTDENDVIVVNTVDSVTEGHVRSKRSPKAGILGTNKCSLGHYLTNQGYCLPCTGQNIPECKNTEKIDLDYSEIYDHADEE